MVYYDAYWLYMCYLGYPKFLEDFSSQGRIEKLKETAIPSSSIYMPTYHETDFGAKVPPAFLHSAHDAKLFSPALDYGAWDCLKEFLRLFGLFPGHPGHTAFNGVK